MIRALDPMDKESLKLAYVQKWNPWISMQEREKYAIIIKYIWSKYTV